MRTPVAVLALLFVSLLLVAGCGGGEESKAPPEEGPTTTGSTVPETTAPAAEPKTPQLLTLTITNSAGERVPVRVEIADTRAEQERGLMERTALAEDAGMLFVFDRELQLPFTMKNTLIPLSIAFIDAGGRIVDILDMQPLDETTPYASVAPYQYALEVNQGFFRERGVEIGNVVELPQQFDSGGMPGSAEVVQAFRDAGLEVGESYPVEEEPGWEVNPTPRTYEEGTRFEIPSLGEDAGGRVFVFGSEGDLAAVRGFYEDLPAPARPYVYTEGEVLVQLNNQLPVAEADRYGTVLKGIA